MGLLSKLFGKKDTIRVTFINAADDSVMSYVDVPQEQLPETFEIDTTMHVEGEDWSVVEADPVHSSEFWKTGSLTLRLSKVEYMDPKDILYSLPSISNELPDAVEVDAIEESAYSMREDDWRQLEFLPPSSRPLIEQEFTAIYEVKEQFSELLDGDMMAFKKCHVRTAIGIPDLGIPMAELLHVLKVSEVEKLRYDGTLSYVQDGFSFATASSTFIGIEKDGQVSELGIVNPSEGTSQEVYLILNQFDILFVNWYHTQVVSKDD